MTNQKQSNFTTVQELGSDSFIPAFSSSENEKITRDNLFNQIKDAVVPKFIYRTVDLLQAADLEADEDEPTYVRCEETEYRLYKITSIAPGANDIALDNGTTATYQVEYRDNGFVIGPVSSAAGALAVFSDTSGETLAEGATPTDAGNALIEIVSVSQKSYPRINSDDTTTAVTVAQLQTDLNLPANTDAEITAIEGDITAIESDISSIESDITGINAELLDRVQTVATFADLATTPAQTGQVFSTVDYDGSGFGSGLYVGKSGTATVGDPFQSASATGGVYLELINSIYSSDMIGNVDLELQIGSGEKYETLTEALAFASRYRCADSKILQLNLKTGFVLNEQVLFENTDFRHVLITSDDAVVTVARSAITTVWRGIRPAFGFAKCWAPVFEVQFEMDASGSDLSQYGIAIRSSFLRSEFGAGFRNAPERNIECAWGSILDIRYGDFSNAGDVGIRVSNGSIAYIRTCKANNCQTGVSVSNAWADFTDGEATGNLFAGVVPNGGGIIIVNNAVITGNVTGGSANHGDITTDLDGKALGGGCTVGGGGGDGIYCNGGEVSITSLIVTNPARVCVRAAAGGTVNCGGSSVLSGGTLSISATNSTINAAGVNISEPTTGQAIFASGGIVNAPSATIVATSGTGANSVIAGSDGAEINVAKATCNGANLALFRFLRGSKLKAGSMIATGCKMTGATQMGRFDSSECIAPSANFSGRLGANSGIDIQLGSIAILTGTDIRNSGGATALNDVRVFTSGSARLNNASVSGQSFAGYNVVKNTITADGSIVFDN